MISALFPHPLLVCDIGGTNVRLGLVRSPVADLELLDPVLTGQAATFEQALQPILAKHALRPRSMLISAAGPVHNRRLSLTNANWILDGPSIAQSFGLTQGLLLNDFEALALSLPSLRKDQTRFIGQAFESQNGSQLILGPGTGLGLSLLVQTRDGYQALPSEAGHMDFGPVSAEDFALWPHIERVHRRISAETLLSGPGLSRLHQARLTNLGKAQSEPLSAQNISAEALRNPQGEAAKTLRLFWQFMARFAGDMAICFAATGGVTLAGGILPKIHAFADANLFREIFSAKAPMQTLLEAMPIRLLIDDRAVLTGLASIAAHPERFALDYKQRAWMQV